MEALRPLATSATLTPYIEALFLSTIILASGSPSSTSSLTSVVPGTFLMISLNANPSSSKVSRLSPFITTLIGLP